MTTSTKITPAPLARQLSDVADEIGQDWPKARDAGRYDPRLGMQVGQHPANPYWQVMSQCTGITRLEGSYGFDSIADVVRYFLSNATGWRGETAKRIKAELQAALALRDSNRSYLR